jgi:pentatricopeptide repeat protein
LGTFLYKDLVESLCKKDELEVASGILHKMIDRGYGFDPAALMPVIDGLGKMGNKKEANSFADKMMEMASVGEVANKVDPNARDIHQKKHNKNGGNNWQNILHRDDGSGIALRSLSRVKKGWGQGDISSFQPPRVDYLDYWEDDG